MNHAQLTEIAKEFWRKDFDDIRVQLTLKFLSRFPESAQYATVDEIVKSVIKHCDIKEIALAEKEALKGAIFKHNDAVHKAYAEELGSVLKQKSVIFSLGSGSEGYTEKTLNSSIVEGVGTEKMLAKDLIPDIKWIGADVLDARTNESFFEYNNFVILPSQNSINYINLLSDEDAQHQKIILANYVYHHMDIEFQDFLNVCNGFDYLFMLEEPVSREDWNIPERRLLLIAYDMLANHVLNPGWMSEVEKNPSLFKVRYLLVDEIPQNASVKRFPGTFPGSVLISLPLK